VESGEFCKKGRRLIKGVRPNSIRAAFVCSLKSCLETACQAVIDTMILFYLLTLCALAIASARRFSVLWQKYPGVFFCGPCLLCYTADQDKIRSSTRFPFLFVLSPGLVVLLAAAARRLGLMGRRAPVPMPLLLLPARRRRRREEGCVGGGGGWQPSLSPIGRCCLTVYVVRDFVCTQRTYSRPKQKCAFQSMYLPPLSCSERHRVASMWLRTLLLQGGVGSGLGGRAPDVLLLQPIHGGRAVGKRKLFLSYFERHVCTVCRF